MGFFAAVHQAGLSYTHDSLNALLRLIKVILLKHKRKHVIGKQRYRNRSCNVSLSVIYREEVMLGCRSVREIIESHEFSRDEVELAVNWFRAASRESEAVTSSVCRNEPAVIAIHVRPIPPHGKL
jgi:hypothetical protein